MSWYETERDNKIIRTLEDISNRLQGKSGFIEIAIEGKKPILINVRYIVEVEDIDENHCAIHIGCGSILQIPIPYNRVVEVIKEAVE